MRLVRVHADRKAHLRPSRTDRCRLRDLGVVFGRQDHEAADQASRARPIDHRLEIGREFAAGEMAVGIDHRTRVPGSAAPGSITIGLPPSGLAASTIPFDSIPISLAG